MILASGRHPFFYAAGYCILAMLVFLSSSGFGAAFLALHEAVTLFLRLYAG